MKRRDFVQRMGLGMGFTVLPYQAAKNELPENTNPYAHFNKDYQSIVTKEGYVLIRLAFEGTDNQQIKEFSGKIEVKHGHLHKLKNYFFESPDDDLDPEPGNLAISTIQTDQDIVVLWLDSFSEKTEIHLKNRHETIKIKLDELVTRDEVNILVNGINLTANLLFDKEIGEISLEAAGINASGNTHRFLIMADPQGGDPSEKTNESPTRMKIHNAFIEETIERAKQLDNKGLFTVVIGDYVDSKGQRANFVTMNNFYKRLRHPVFVECGNHETPYNAKFSPGYNMKILDNYFDAQNDLCGINKLLYSFNLGKWHIIVWPDPLRSEFWPTHPHYFDWLEKDLEKYRDRPTLFLQHVPIHPIGINPLINYAESIVVKKLLLDILSKHGNVHYILSGHVHIPLKSALKTAVEYKGMKLINLPAAGYRPRAFGEEDFYGGPTQGFVIADLAEEKLTLTYKNVTREEFVFPDKLPAFDENKYPLWLTEKWELPAETTLKNGNFSDGLKHWHKRYVYTEDIHPSNICEAKVTNDNKTALYLFSKPRGYNAPGQDRMPQTINRICQAVVTEPDKFPVLSLAYLLETDAFNPELYTGAYVWIEGYHKSTKRLNLVYSVGKMYQNLGGRYAQNRVVFPQHFDIAPVKSGWNAMHINIAADQQKQNSALTYDSLQIDRLILNFGTWTINDGTEHKTGIWFTDILLGFQNGIPGTGSELEGKHIEKKPEHMLWNFRNKHTAGEHWYATQNELYPDGIKYDLNL